MGILFAFLSSFSYAVANLFGKKAAHSGDLVSGFVSQYGFVTVVSAVFALLSWQAVFRFDLSLWPYVAILGIAGYTGIFAYLSSSRHMPMGTALAIAYGYVIVLYAVNAALFPESETLSGAKYAFAIAFFASIAAFLVDAGRKKAAFLKFVWMPLVSLVCWIAYFACANYVVKTGVTTPLWGLFLAEGSIFATAASVFLIRLVSRSFFRHFAGKSNLPSDDRLAHNDEASASIAPTGNPKALAAFAYGIAMAFFLALWTGLLLLSYDLVAANLSNTIGLSTTSITAVLGFFVFKERLPRSDWILIAVSTALLCGFLIVP